MTARDAHSFNFLFIISANCFSHFSSSFIFPFSVYVHSITTMKLLVVLMEETREQGTDVNRPRKLNLNLPLLSTRRLGGHADKEETYCATKSQTALQDTSDRIPFCWEQAPGKPKDGHRNDIHEAETPRPTLPPCRWHLQNETAKNGDLNLDDHDDGCDADVDEDGEEIDVFSDAIDVLSLTEAIDIAQKSEDGHRLDRLNLESVDSTDSQSLSFMMERFLPDATALAASSALCSLNNCTKKLPHPYNYSEEYVSRTVGQSYPSEASHKGCGLEVLFPWRLKHKLCGVKSPVRRVSPKVQQPQYCSTKQKKLCSLNKPLRDVNKDI